MSRACWKLGGYNRFKIIKMENKKTYSEDYVLAMFKEIKEWNSVVIKQNSDLVDKLDSILASKATKN